MTKKWISWDELVHTDYISSDNDLLKKCAEGLPCFDENEKPLISATKLKKVWPSLPAITFGKIFLPKGCKLSIDTYIDKLQFEFFCNNENGEFFIVRKDIFPLSMDILVYQYIRSGYTFENICKLLYHSCRDMNKFTLGKETSYHYPITERFICPDQSLKIDEFSIQFEIITVHQNPKNIDKKNPFDIPYRLVLDNGFEESGKITIFFEQIEDDRYDCAIEKYWKDINELEFTYGDNFFVYNFLPMEKQSQSTDQEIFWNNVKNGSISADTYNINRMLISFDNQEVAAPSLSALDQSLAMLNYNITQCTQHEFFIAHLFASFQTYKFSYIAPNDKSIFIFNLVYQMTDNHILPHDAEGRSRILNQIHKFKFRVEDLSSHLGYSMPITQEELKKQFIEDWLAYTEELDSKSAQAIRIACLKAEKDEASLIIYAKAQLPDKSNGAKKAYISRQLTKASKIKHPALPSFSSPWKPLTLGFLEKLAKHYKVTIVQ